VVVGGDGTESDVFKDGVRVEEDEGKKPDGGE